MPSFAFTKMIVADLDAEVRFFEEVIGLRVVMRMTIGEGEKIADEAILSASGGAGDGPSLALLRYRHQPAPPAGELVLGFMVEDADGVAAAALRGGGHILLAPRVMPDHGVRVGFVADPEGHQIEIVQPLKPAG